MLSLRTLSKVALLLVLALSTASMLSVSAGSLCQSGDDISSPPTGTPAPTSQVLPTPAPTATPVFQFFRFYEEGDYSGNSASVVVESDVCYTLPPCVSGHVTSLTWDAPSGQVADARFCTSDCEQRLSGFGSTMAGVSGDITSDSTSRVRAFMLESARDAPIKRYETIPCAETPSRQLRH